MVYKIDLHQMLKILLIAGNNRNKSVCCVCCCLQPLQNINALKHQFFELLKCFIFLTIYFQMYRLEIYVASIYHLKFILSTVKFSAQKKTIRRILFFVAPIAICMTKNQHTTNGIFLKQLRIGL